MRSPTEPGRYIVGSDVWRRSTSAQNATGRVSAFGSLMRSPSRSVPRPGFHHRERRVRADITRDLEVVARCRAGRPCPRPIGAPQQKAAGLDRHQRRRLLLAARRQPLIANVVDRHTHLARFAEIWIASLAPTFLVGYQLASRRRTASQVLGARRSPFAVVRLRPVLPPGDRPPLLIADGQRRWIGWAWGP